MRMERETEMSRLKALLLELSVEFQPVVLSSGQPSDVYVDCKQTALHPEGASLLGTLLYDLVCTSKIGAIKLLRRLVA